MPYATLIQPQQLDAMQQTQAPAVLVCDCSFDLADTDAGRHAFEQAHIPGAIYLHLDADLSGEKTGVNGRHPLPPRASFVESMAARGVGDETQVIAYDRSGGMYAARLWWLLRWAGHAAVAVLDGGFPAWEAAGLAIEQGGETPRAAGRLTARPSLVKWVTYADVQRSLLAKSEEGARLVIDARAPDRFRGENETLDAIGGHIPGARNRLFKNNLQPDGRFKPPAQLKAEFDHVTGGRRASELIHQCGSGVTACHNLLAMEVAGAPGGALYAGSWSEWCRQPGAPIATGEE